MSEIILRDDDRGYTLFPLLNIQTHSPLYKKALASLWTVEVVLIYQKI